MNCKETTLPFSLLYETPSRKKRELWEGYPIATQEHLCRWKKIAGKRRFNYRKEVMIYGKYSNKRVQSCLDGPTMEK